MLEREREMGWPTRSSLVGRLWRICSVAAEQPTFTCVVDDEDREHVPYPAQSRSRMETDGWAEMVHCPDNCIPFAGQLTGTQKTSFLELAGHFSSTFSFLFPLSRGCFVVCVPLYPFLHAGKADGNLGQTERNDTDCNMAKQQGGTRKKNEYCCESAANSVQHDGASSVMMMMMILEKNSLID